MLDKGLSILAVSLSIEMVSNILSNLYGNAVLALAILISVITLGICHFRQKK
ncbi:Uncharacterised protein [Suttonella ornithocola]|uniref:Uncharacterized protein n=1 Tax=Suttonella ornithocola TaxID=279832 RepID=A0A380MWU4_9GAMM|nr:Uncharacterised protein [Suttonella ornithocola]